MEANFENLAGRLRRETDSGEKQILKCRRGRESRRKDSDGWRRERCYARETKRAQA